MCIPVGHKKIRVHPVYAIKHDGRHKARLVADGHLTDIPMESVYSGVVSLKGLRLVIFLAELNGLKLVATDIGNVHLEAHTKEKLVIVAGKEFGHLQGHLLLISRALYGLQTSGLRWHERFSDRMRELGFLPCKAEPDIWMRPADDRSFYEYVAVYVDDLAIAMKNPESFTKQLEDVYKFKLKGTGEITYHLGMDFKRDTDTNILSFNTSTYTKQLIESCEAMCGKMNDIDKCTSPIVKGDHPELDDSEFLDIDGIKKYQSMTGALQWVVTIGRFDVQVADMTLSSFRAAPRRGTQKEQRESTNT